MKQLLILSAFCVTLFTFCSTNSGQSINNQNPFKNAVLPDSVRIDTIHVKRWKWGAEEYKAQMASYKARYHNLYTKELVTPFTVTEGQLEELRKKNLEEIKRFIPRFVENDGLKTLQFPELSTPEDIARCTYKSLPGYLITANIFDYDDPENQRFGDYLTLDTIHVITMVFKENEYITNFKYNWHDRRFANWANDITKVNDIKMAYELSDNVFFVRYPNGSAMQIGFLKNGDIYLIGTNEIVNYASKKTRKSVYSESIRAPFAAKDYIPVRGNMMFENYAKLIEKARKDTVGWYTMYRNSQVKVFQDDK